MLKTMKYFIYISGAKVEMLFEQIPSNRLKKITTNLGINLGFFKAEFQSETNAVTLAKKIQIIEEYLTNKTGTIDYPEDYVCDEAYVKWGPYDEFDELIYFTGATSSTGFALGGSMRNCVGNGNSTATTSYSLSPYLVSALVKKRAIRCTSPAISTFPTRTDGNQKAIAAIEEGLIENNVPFNKIKFFAKKLLHGQGRHYGNVWLGTPIYVELIE